MLHHSPKFLVILFAILAAPISAAEFYEKHKGWTVIDAEDACGMTMEYEGPGATTLLLLKTVEDTIIVGVTNSNWSSETDEKYDVSFVLNGKVYGGGAAVGYKSGYRRGFRLGLESSFEADFRNGSSLWVYLGETKIDQLSLAGTNAAFAAVNRCLKRVKAEKAAEDREKARWADIPKDPFADKGDDGATGLTARAPRPSGSPGYWFRTYDYPRQAIRENREGVVGFKLLVGSDGRAKTCEVTETSGHDDLDAITCTVLMRRARFNPAIDATGKAIEAWWENSTSWNIPEPPPPPAEPITCKVGEICTRD